ncbi:MAG: hypothetical protein JWQ34_424 [Mucilaginibacter sp.]|uniref:type II toxin-antitoxin system VapC family toxin n=1 Tax=Mucilaginibacter sp. TaxID=1882438 RepID=UPI0026234E6D|nr:type II toxin-antitoxin system VapC family toxin [Mucilaginibacter sp.]MDB5002199.1 hypothetical protein [Mucilaginibacter sp.]
MKLFLDTSTLIKLYFKEEGTIELDKVLANYTITKIFLSEVSKVEFFSAIYKKARTGSLTLQNVHDILDAFIADEEKYTFIPIEAEIINLAKSLIEKHGIEGLRTLDAIQLATACIVSQSIDIALTNDKLLNLFLVSENIKTSV